jgi:hypothetical protein
MVAACRSSRHSGLGRPQPLGVGIAGHVVCISRPLGQMPIPSSRRCSALGGRWCSGCRVMCAGVLTVSQGGEVPAVLRVPVRSRTVVPALPTDPWSCSRRVRCGNRQATFDAHISIFACEARLRIRSWRARCLRSSVDFSARSSTFVISAGTVGPCTFAFPAGAAVSVWLRVLANRKRIVNFLNFPEPGKYRASLAYERSGSPFHRNCREFTRIPPRPQTEENHESVICAPEAAVGRSSK